MEISGISGSSSYDEWKLIQAQREKEQKNAEQTGTVGSAEVSAAENTVDSLAQTEKVPDITNTDRVEISSEGRAYQQSMQPAAAAPAENSASSASSENSVNLSSLTEDEIQNLVDEGTITRAEANAELARRAAEEAENAEKDKAPGETNQYDPYIEEE
ncbi:hypothetical protein AALB39_19895 [Lachnospiraceae bacterium 54-53]